MNTVRTMDCNQMRQYIEKAINYKTLRCRPFELRLAYRYMRKNHELKLTKLQYIADKWGAKRLYAIGVCAKTGKADKILVSHLPKAPITQLFKAVLKAEQNFLAS